MSIEMTVRKRSKEKCKDCWPCSLTEKEFNTKVEAEAILLADYLANTRRMEMSVVTCVFATMLVRLKEHDGFVEGEDGIMALDDVIKDLENTIELLKR